MTLPAALGTEPHVWGEVDWGFSTRYQPRIWAVAVFNSERITLTTDPACAFMKLARESAQDEGQFWPAYLAGPLPDKQQKEG